MALIFWGIKIIAKNVCLKHNCQAQEDLILGSFFVIQTQERGEGNVYKKCHVIRKTGF